MLKKSKAAITLAPRAESDVDGIIEVVNQEAGRAVAEKVYDALSETMQGVAVMPKLGRVFKVYRGYEVRRAVVPKYHGFLVLYHENNGGGVTVLRVVNARQDFYAVRFE